MKNIFLGIVGIFITIYLVLIGLDIYTVKTKENTLEQVVSQSVENTLESQYASGSKEVVNVLLEMDIGAAVSDESKVTIDVQVVDLEKGLLSVVVSEDIKLITGHEKTITVEKTAIVERMDTDQEMVTVDFYVDGEIYKEFSLVKGEECPVPKVPSDVFAGWVEYGTDSASPVESIGQVWENKIFLAIRE